MKILSMLLIISAVFMSGCLSIQGTYKQLYQVTPEKVQLEAEKK